jgi:hypothetical protein
MVAHRPSKPSVAGSNPVSRSIPDCRPGRARISAKSSWNDQELLALLVDGLCAIQVLVGPDSLSSEKGEPCRTRTCDTLLKRQVLCQLS